MRSTNSKNINFAKAKNCTSYIMKIWLGLRIFLRLFASFLTKIWSVLSILGKDNLTLVRLIWPHYLHCRYFWVNINCLPSKIWARWRKIDVFLNFYSYKVNINKMISLTLCFQNSFPEVEIAIFSRLDLFQNYFTVMQHVRKPGIIEVHLR